MNTVKVDVEELQSWQRTIQEVRSLVVTNMPTGLNLSATLDTLDRLNADMEGSISTIDRAGALPSPRRELPTEPDGDIYFA